MSPAQEADMHRQSSEGKGAQICSAHVPATEIDLTPAFV